MQKQQLHRQLSRLDVEKDAIQTKGSRVTAENKPFFTRIADELFGTLESCDELELEKRIDAFVGKPVDYKEARVYCLDDEMDLATILPVHIRTAIQDSGVAPASLNPDLQYLITPASYLDPCSRSWGTPVVYGLTGTLTREHFVPLQMPVREIMSKWNPLTQECIMYITLENVALNPKFNAGFQPMNPDGVFYFDKGNTRKNQWFQNPLPVGRFSVEDVAKALIVCKELGDTLQAYYGSLYMKSLDRDMQKQVCLFTCDKKLVRRCQLLQLPVIYTNAYREKEKKLTSVYEVPTMPTLHSDMVNYYRGYIDGLNKSNVAGIQAIISQGWYNTRRKERIPVSERLAQELHRVCVLIQERQKAFALVDTSKMSLAEYSTFVNYYRSIQVVYPPQNTFCFMSDYLFVHPFPGDEPILGRLRSMLVTGGSFDENDTTQYIFDLSQYEHNFIQLDRLVPEGENLFHHFRPSLVVLYDMYTYLGKVYPRKSDSELCFLAVDLFKTMHLYSTYTFQTFYNDEYIQGLLDMQGRIPDYPDYVAFYNSFIENEEEKVVVPDVSAYVEQLGSALAVLRQYRESMNAVKNYGGTLNQTRKRGVKARGTRKLHSLS